MANQKDKFIVLSPIQPIALMLSVFMLIGQSMVSQKNENIFFVFNNIMDGDSTFVEYNQQIGLLKDYGFSHIDIVENENFESRLSILKRYNFKVANYYFGIDLDKANIDEDLIGHIAMLKGSNTLLTPYFHAESETNKKPNYLRNLRLLGLLNELSTIAIDNNLEIAIYPHYGFYLENLEQALSFVKVIDQKHVGLAFNLCHWLANTNIPERDNLYCELEMISPYLKFVSVSGANNVVSDKNSVWDDYILPLNHGSFDTFGLLSYLISDLNFKGPVGVQGYGLKGEKVKLIRETKSKLQEYKALLYQYD
jgi:sugar phosphate isomerase/epimerase